MNICWISISDGGAEERREECIGTGANTVPLGRARRPGINMGGVVVVCLHTGGKKEREEGSGTVPQGE